MKLLTVLLLLIMLFAVAQTGKAEQLPQYAWAVGPELSYFAYEEPHFAETRGFLAGLTGSFAYHDGLMLRAEGRFSFGSLYYTSPGSGTADGIPDYLWEFRGTGGYDILLPAGSAVTPYGGFGYRYLNDNSAGKVTSLGASGYERESNYYYSPLGIMFTSRARQGWSIEAMTEYDYFWKGEQVSHLEDVLPSASSLENRQNSGYGLRGAIAFSTRAGMVEYSFGPFLRYWNIRESEHVIFVDATGILCGSTVCIGYEPANHSMEYGVSVQARF